MILGVVHSFSEAPGYKRFYGTGASSSVRNVDGLGRGLWTLAAFFLLSSILASATAQGSSISVNLGTALPMPIGQTANVAVTVTDTSNSTIQLTFVGLRLEWNLPNSFFIGDNSEKGAVLTGGEQIMYTIPVTVPANVTPGVHRLSAYVTYRILNQSNSTGVNAGWWVTDIQFAYPQTQQSQAAAATNGPQPSFSGETIGVLVVVVAIGLVLERDRIKRRVWKSRQARSHAPAQPEGGPPVGVESPVTKKPPVEEKKEEDL